MRDAVSTCTTASVTAPVASHTLPANRRREDAFDDVRVRRFDVPERH
jgi:hypothetical protein